MKNKAKNVTQKNPENTKARSATRVLDRILDAVEHVGDLTGIEDLPELLPVPFSAALHAARMLRLLRPIAIAAKNKKDTGTNK